MPNNKLTDLKEGDRVELELERGALSPLDDETISGTVSDVGRTESVDWLDGDTTGKAISVETGGGEDRRFAVNKSQLSLTSVERQETTPPNRGTVSKPPGPQRRTDIGREPDGEFGRPETDPEIAPAPIARDNESGKFGLDPFDLTSGGVGDKLDLFDGDDRR